MNRLGHNPEGKTVAFIRKHSDFKVPLKIWGKKPRTEAGDIVKASFNYV